MSDRTAATISDDDWAEFAARLKQYVGRRLPPALADDVTSDVLLKLVGQQDKLAAAGNPIAWIHRVARNTIIDTYRRRATAGRVIDEDAAGDARMAPEDAGADGKAGPTGPDDLVEEPVSALSECVIPFIRRLPAGYADALMLTEIDGLRQQEAADRLGISLTALKSRVRRGRGKLQQAVLGCCAVSANARGDILDFHPRTTAPCGENAACGEQAAD